MGEPLKRGGETSLSAGADTELVPESHVYGLSEIEEEGRQAQVAYGKVLVIDAIDTLEHLE